MQARELAELIEISRAVGSDPDLVQGGGGNTSVKTADGKTMFVKASGTALADMDENRGWAEMDLEAARGVLALKELAASPAEEREREVIRLLSAAVRRPRGARPSVESSLHAILDRVVIHTHPVGLNAFLSSRESRHRFAEVFLGEAGAPLYVPYVDPGYTLAARLEEELKEYEERHGKPPAVVLLENHGLFVAAGDVKSCLELSRRVTDLGKQWIGGDRINPLEFPWTPSPAGPGAAAELRGALLRGGCAPGVLRRDQTAIAAEFLAHPSGISQTRQGAFTPDQIVYCRTFPLVLEGGEVLAAHDRSVAAYHERHGFDPRVILRPGRGVYYAAPDLAQLRVVADVYRAAMTAIVRSGRGGGPRFLNRAEARFIEGWEVESFRAALSGGEKKRLGGRIAAVTGAASGLGKGIAAGLVAAGVTVAAFDINAESLTAVAAGFPRGRYLPIAADVTDEGAVLRAFQALEAATGGLDFLVNAAGIAPSYPLAEFPLAAWKKALDINLTGYFLCAREAARLLLRQGAGGGIINLTSKSGLEASRENSAYNATKAGEIHLMRGWALELGRAGIRVNCVAPGNVFKGSQIWNDDYLRACAKKKGIRPEEVIPYYTSLSALGKEIEPEDVAAAVVFLLSDEARNITGQTLVVDGGQVLVR